MTPEKTKSEHFYIFTEINGERNYVRRVKHTPYSTTVTMFTPTTTKAKDFGTLDRCTEVLRRMGIGYAIESK